MAPKPFDMAQALIDEVLSSPESYIPPSDSATVRHIIISIAKYARSIQKSLARSRAAIMHMGGDSPLTRQRESASPPSDAYSSEESDDDQVNSETFRQLSIGYWDTRHWGKSSNVRFFYSAMNKDDGNTLNLTRLKRSQYWELDIVSCSLFVVS